MSKIYINLDLLRVHWDEHGDLDYGISAVVGELTPEQMKEFRAEIVAAIGTAEQMWRRRRSEIQNANMAQA